MPILPALGKLRQEDHKFKDSLGPTGIKFQATQ
jgi:hypothetical protein